MGFAWRRSLASGVALLALSTPVVGQVRTGSIAGTITDDTGGALPGVTATLTSPALQVPQVVTVSDAQGEYQFGNLPAGTYRVAYDLSGFTPLVREQLALTTGFAARVDVVLRVASLVETVTVSGQSPLVDITNTRGGTTVSQQILAATPNNNNYQDMYLMVGGTVYTGPPLTGQQGLRANGTTPKTYGYSIGLQTTNMVEGIQVQPNEQPDFSSVEEVEIKTFGHTADQENPGAVSQFIVKSGGDQFHGRYVERVQHHRFQSANINDALRAQGITSGSGIRYFNDLSGDLGGRLIRSRLWFYGALHDIRNKQTLAGFALDPGGPPILSSPRGQFGSPNDVPALPTGKTRNGTIKLSYQATPKNKFIGLYSKNQWWDDSFNASSPIRFTPQESSLIFTQPATQKKIEWQGALNNRLVVNQMYGESGYLAVRIVQPSAVGIPNRFDRETGYRTGTSSDGNVGERILFRRQLNGRLDYSPARSLLGSHTINAGYRLEWGSFSVNFPDLPGGNYRLIYDRVNGVSHQPVEIQTLNRPVGGDGARQNFYGVYITDAWQPTKRLTVNMGMRREGSTNWVPEQVKVQGQFGSSGTFPRVDAGTFGGWAPRLGAAFDLAGNGKTVVKATYGWYNHHLPTTFGTGFANEYNQNFGSTANYRWRDQDGNNLYTPGEVDLSPNGPDFLSASGATVNVVNPDLKLNYTREVTASLERELTRTGMSIRALYVYKDVGQSSGINPLRPYEVYNQVLTRRDAGPDNLFGTSDDGGLTTIYDFDPALRASRFVQNMLINNPLRDAFHNLELTLNRPQRGKWFAFTSLLATKNHRWLNGGVVQTPNDELFPLDETWNLSYRLAAGYNLPYGVRLSTLYQLYDGLPGQRTSLFGVPDPAGGRPLPSSGSFTLRMEPFGARQMPIRSIANLRAAKDFRFGRSRRVTFEIDVHNVFNSNVAWVGDGGINYQSGPTFGYVTGIVSPRVMRFGVAYEF